MGQWGKYLEAKLTINAFPSNMPIIVRPKKLIFNLKNERGDVTRHNALRDKRVDPVRVGFWNQKPEYSTVEMINSVHEGPWWNQVFMSQAMDRMTFLLRKLFRGDMEIFLFELSICSCFILWSGDGEFMFFLKQIIQMENTVFTSRRNIPNANSR